MKRAILILAILALVGCSGLTNDQIIAETRKCREAGMGVAVVMNLFTYETEKIICTPNARPTP
jgi:hypothetical protein